MSMMRENLTPPAQTNTMWFGWFAEDMDDLVHKAWVIIPDFATDKRIGPCFWQSRDSTSMPDKGDRCLVTFDNRGNGWIIAWWPFAN